MVSMNRLSTRGRARIVACLVEGNSIRATCRMTGAAKNTVTKLLVDLGRACAEYQDLAIRNLTCKRPLGPIAKIVTFKLTHYLRLMVVDNRVHTA